MSDINKRLKQLYWTLSNKRTNSDNAEEVIKLTETCNLIIETKDLIKELRQEVYDLNERILDLE